MRSPPGRWDPRRIRRPARWAQDDGPTIETQSWSDWDAYGTPRHTTSAVGFDLQAEELRTTDDLGRIVSTNHSIAGTPLGTVTYGYTDTDTDNGSVASVSTTWAGGYRLNRSGTGLVNEVRDFSTAALLAQIDGRDALGRPTHAFTVDGQINRAYDQMGRDTWFSAQSGALLDQRSYEYDDLGRASFVHHEDAEGIWLQQFVYENPGRLTDDIRSASTGTTVYAWDAAGNRTSITKDGGATTISTYDNADRLLTVGATTLTYDPFGGIIDDGAGFGIPRGADGAEIGVDALSGSPATRLYTFWRDAGGEPVATEDVDGLHRQVWGNPGSDLPLAGEGPEGNWLWVAVDGIVLGQLRDGVALGAASDPSGSIAYFDGELAGVPGAFGEGAGLAGVRHAWTGMETLPGTPYQLAQHRLYDTANGRFTVNDPIGLAGGDHRYAYAGGDLVQFVDPSGLAFAQPGPGGLKRYYAGLGDDPNFASQTSFHDGDVHADQPLRSSVRSSPTGDSGGSQSPAEDSCTGGMGCPPSGGEPGDEGDGTGTYGPWVPVLNAKGEDKAAQKAERHAERAARRDGREAARALRREGRQSLGERLRDLWEGWAEWVMQDAPDEIPAEGSEAWNRPGDFTRVVHRGLKSRLFGGWGAGGDGRDSAGLVLAGMVGFANPASTATVVDVVTTVSMRIAVGIIETPLLPIIALAAMPSDVRPGARWTDATHVTPPPVAAPSPSTAILPGSGVHAWGPEKGHDGCTPELEVDTDDGRRKKVSAKYDLRRKWGRHRSR